MRLRIAVAIVAMLVLSPSAAYAHGERAVGPVRWTVGWAEEPAFVGFKNAVELRLDRDGQPVAGAQDSLKVRVSLGSEESDVMELRAAFGTPGTYLADLVPTAPGDYTFHFTGTIGGTEIDERFTGSRDGFDEVTETDAVSFPADAPSNAELARAIASLDDAVADARDGAADARSARTLTIVALVVAVLALVLALRRRRT